VFLRHVASAEDGHARRRLHRALLTLGMVLALAIPAGAGAATSVERIPFETTVLLCNGDLLQVSGPLLATFTTTATPSGGLLVASHFQPQGVSGVDLTTGTRFRGTGLTRDLFVISSPGGFTETSVNLFRIQATGGAESYIFTALFHITVTPDGTVRAFVDNFSSTC
jgi:hypothetical protein